MTRISTRERLARERVIAAQLAIAEAESEAGPLGVDLDLLGEARSARRAPHQIVLARGRRG